MIILIQRQKAPCTPSPSADFSHDSPHMEQIRRLSRERWARFQCTELSGLTLSGPMLLLTQLIAVTVNLVVFAYFAQLGCDPMQSVNH